MPLCFVDFFLFTAFFIFILNHSMNFASKLQQQHCNVAASLFVNTLMHWYVRTYGMYVCRCAQFVSSPVAGGWWLPLECTQQFYAALVETYDAAAAAVAAAC
uniref:Secreted protein n=1 Tax=Ceratitis capitata TaxID=7213 RepID=W8BCQ1_CERCA